jgi:splicing factor 3B subunit 3
MLEVVDSL